MKAFRAKKIPVLVISVLLLVCRFTSAQVTPWTDQTAHFDNPSVMKVSDDGQYLLSADKHGRLAVRDMETKKIIRQFFLYEDIRAAFFDKDNHIYCVHKSTPPPGAQNITISVTKINLSNKSEEKIFSRQLPREQNLSIDVSPKKDRLAITNDYLLEEIDLTTFKTNASFDVIEAHYNPENELVIKNDMAAYMPIVSDLNNKSIYWDDVDSSYLFSDYLNGKSFKLPYDSFHSSRRVKRNRSGLSEVFTINAHFQFSPNHRLVLISYVKNRTRFFSLYDHQRDKVVWSKPTGIGRLLKNSFRWLNDQTFLIAMFPEYIKEMDIYAEAKATIQNDYRFFPSIGVSNDLSEIMYSSQSPLDTATYLFSFDKPNSKQKLDSAYYDHLLVEDGNKIIYSLSNSDSCSINIKSTDLKDLNIIKGPIPFDKISEIIPLKSAKKIIYNAYHGKQCFHQFNDIQIDDIIRNELNQKIGFNYGGTRFIHRASSSKDPDTSFILEYLYGNHLVIHDDESGSNTVIIDMDAEDIRVSYDENLISFKSDHKAYYIFDIQKEEIILDTSLLKYVYFSDTSPMACRLNDENDLFIWNTQSSDEPIVIELESNFKHIEDAAFLEEENKLFFLEGGNIHVVNYASNHSRAELLYSDGFPIESLQLSKDKNILQIVQNKQSKYGSKFVTHTFLDRRSLDPIHSKGYSIFQSSKIITNDNLSQYLFYDNNGQFKLIDVIKDKTVFTLRLFNKGDWLAYTPEGYFDASKKGRESLYYVYDDEVILYSQIKERLWEPGLIKKLMKDPDYYKGLEVGEFSLYPKSKIRLIENTDSVDIKLIPTSGGIGRVSLYINGKEVIEDINTNREKHLTISLLDHEDYLYRYGINQIGIQTHNKEDWISSRINYLYLDTKLDAAKDTISDLVAFIETIEQERDHSPIKKPGLFGLFIGTSNYDNPDLKLEYADDDAIALDTAFQLIGKDLYDENRFNLTQLTSSSGSVDALSNRKNILNALAYIEEHALIDDIVVLFLSGHGVTIGDDFYYLTAQAGNVNLENDSIRRSQVSISSSEILESLRRIKANKQILVLDACHSGQIAEFLSNNSKALSTSQQKALESLNDKMGTYVLASSEANQKSFEVKQLRQGILTHSLLLGMSGEIDDTEMIDVVKLLNFASRQTEEVSKNILGTGQRPVIGISEGGNSFDIGFKNELLKPPVPSEYVKLARGRFGIFPTLNDPLNFEERINSTLAEQGVFGGPQDYIFLKNNAKDAAKLTATYTLLENDVVDISLYIIQDEKILGGPFKFQTTQDELSFTFKEMINKAVNFMKSNP